MFIAGDIGGTKTVLGLFNTEGGKLVQVRQAVFPSRGHKSLEEIIAKFLLGERSLNLETGCFGVAGAVIEGKCKTTNLPWDLDEANLADFIQAPRVKLLNDLEAAAFGMLYLKPDEVIDLNPNHSGARNGNIAVIAAGTGLGEAILFWDGNRHHPSASEGGHSDFAPTNDIEIALFQWLRQHHPDHVSYERILSGPGIFNLFRFITETGIQTASASLTEKLASGADPSAIVSQMALSKSDPAAIATMDLFASIYGSECGNLALKCLSTGGAFVCGGIAPKILPILTNGKFLESFYSKGRFQSLMKGMRVQVALNPEAPLIGAANYAALLINK